MREFIIILTVCQGVVSAFFDNMPWNSLKVKWDINSLSSYTFATMPQTVKKAVKQQFTKLSDCDLKAPWRGARYYKDGEYALILLFDVQGNIAGIQSSAPWRGARFYKDGEYPLILLFDVQGNIAGIQSSIPSNQRNGYPQTFLQPPFVRDGNRWVISVYFTDPSKICTTGRSATQVVAEGTGTDLYIQNSTRPEDSTLIPHNVEDLANTLWTKGNCFYTMGLHYFYNLTEDMECSRLFPVFLMFNKNKLNAFGFAFTTGIESPRYEHPPSYSYTPFIAPKPKCLAKEASITTMHVFLNNYPRLNFC